MTMLMTAPGGLTAHDLIRRRDYITATDAAAIVGTSIFKTSYDVWLEKCTDMENIKPSAAMVWGSLLEDDIIHYTQFALREFLGDDQITTTRLGIRRAHANGVMSATLDARIVDRPEAIEAKTHASLRPNVDLTDWGDPWTDSVPAGYRDQCLAQLACAPELERVWLVLSVGRSVPTIYCVDRAKWPNRIALIETACCDFWDAHILTGVPPHDSGPGLETVKRVRELIDPGRIVALPDELLEEFRTATEDISRMEKRKKGLDARIRAALIGAERGTSAKGHCVVIKSVNRKGYSVSPTTYTQLGVELNAGTPDGL